MGEVFEALGEAMTRIGVWVFGGWDWLVRRARSRRVDDIGQVDTSELRICCGTEPGTRAPGNL